MRRMIIGFIIAFAAIALGLVFLMAYSMRGGSVGTFEISTLKLVDTQKVTLEGIDTINISYRSDNVVFYTSDTDELILKEYKDYSPEEDELSRISKSGNDLTIKSGRQRNILTFRLFSGNSRIELYLPSKHLEKLIVETSSGNISSDLTFQLSEFAATSTSGNIKINEVYADLISVSASSGNITFKVAEGNRKFSTTSGNIKVFGGAGDSDFTSTSGNITVEKASGYLEADASSGDINILASEGGGAFETSSGNIKLELKTFTKNVKLQASSGNISLTLPRSASFDFNSDTSSGDIRTFFDDELSYNKKGNNASGSVGENPQLDIDIATSSGNIRVND